VSNDLPEVSWALAFLAGSVSFVSPCVLPLIPGYLSYVSGLSVDDLEAGASGQAARVIGQSVVFVMGFAAVFMALGASASAVGAALADYRPLLTRLSGLFIIAMGLSLMGVLRIGALLRAYHLPAQRRPRGALGVLLLGGAFAFAWIPCVGPILASILLYAGAAATVRTGALLLLVYALGLGLPFILTGLAFTRATRALRWLRRYSGWIEAASGLALVAVGMLVLSNRMFYISIWGQKLFTRLGLNFWQSF
jgi:cytochrome c-type biogenesis protein